MVKILKYCGILGAIIAVYYRVMILLYQKNEAKRYVKKKIYDYEMYLDMQDPGISRTLLLFGRRELEHKLILHKVLRPGMTVLDIGANIGYYAIMESQWVGPHGKIVAVEPSPNNIKLLQRNVDLNRCKNVQVFQGAISDRCETRDFYMARSSNLNTFHNTGSGVHDLTGDTISVTTHTVETIMHGIGKPDLLRMDVEGHEVEILAGMLPAIEQGRLNPMIIFETHITRYHEGHDMKSILTRIFNAGYRVKYLASNAESGTKRINAKGYRGSEKIKTDFVHRVIYENVKSEDAIDFICHIGGARTVLLERP